jgi:hypothetical protein
MRDPGAPRPVSFRTGGSLVVSVKYEAVRMLPAIEFELVYYSADGKTRIAAARTGEDGGALAVSPPGGTVEFTCGSLPLEPGAYYLGARVRDVETGKTLAWWDGETRLYVGGGQAPDDRFHIPHTWRHVHGEGSAPPVSVLSKPAG